MHVLAVLEPVHGTTACLITHHSPFCPPSFARHTTVLKVWYDASAEDLLAALTALEPIYSAGVESDPGNALRAWHVTLVSAQDYEPVFADGYLLEGTHATVLVSNNTRRSGIRTLR